MSRRSDRFASRTLRLLPQFLRGMTSSRTLCCVALVLLLAGLARSSSPAASPQSAAGKAAWTLMIYEDADNSLETPQLENVKEMLQVGSADRTARTGRSKPASVEEDQGARRTKAAKPERVHARTAVHN